MSTQIRLRSAVAGSNQGRLEDWMVAVNNFMGIAGNEWDNVPGTPPGKGWDQVTAFNGNLSGVAGSDMVAILQAIDDLALGGTDTHFADTNLTATGPRVHDWAGNDFTLQNALAIDFAADGAITATGACLQLKHDDAAPGGCLRLFESTTNGTNYVALHAGDSGGAPLAASYGITLPRASAAANGQVMSVVSGGGTNAVELQWSAAPGDTNILIGSVTATGSYTHDMAGFDLTFINTDDWQITASTSVATFTTNQRLQLLGATGTQSGVVALYENDSVNYVALQAPDTIATNFTIDLPNVTAPADGNILRVASGGGTSNPILEWAAETDTNLTTGSYTRTASAGAVVHEFNNNNLTIQGNTAAVHTYTAPTVTVNGTTDANVTGALFLNLKSDAVRLLGNNAATAGNIRFMESTNGGGTNYVQLKAAGDLSETYTAQLPSATPAANGKILKVLSGGGTANVVLEWGDDTGSATDTSITAGTLLVASGNRTADFGGFSLGLTNATTIDLSGSGAVTTTSPSLDVRNNTSSIAGELHLFEAADSTNDNFIGIKVPDAVGTTYTMTLPVATPTANGKILKVLSGGGTASPVLEWGDDSGAATDTSITAGTLLIASANRTADFGGFSVDLTNASTVGFSASSTVTATGTSLDVRNTTGTLAGKLRIFEDANHAGDNFFSISAATAMTADYDYTWPSATPGVNDYVMTSSTAGVLEWKHAPDLTTYERAYITLDTDYTAGTQINLDGTSVNQTLVTNSDVIVMTGIASQADLMASKKISFWVDGIKSDVSAVAGAHCTATFVSTTAISLTQNLPAGTVLEIERIS